MNGLAAACALTRWATQAAAVSVARVADDHLLYVAADGVGAESIVGTRLSAGRGIAGFAAATGQSLTVRDPESDPRFAREAAAATGYVPASIQCIPVEDGDGEVVGVLSILDRGENPLGAGVTALPLERVSELVGALMTGEPSGGVDARLAQLTGADRDRALAVLAALLDTYGR